MSTSKTILARAGAGLALVLTIAAVPTSASAEVVRFGAEPTGDGTRAYYGRLTVAPSGDVYALQPDPDNRVLRFTPALGFERTWGRQGADAGEFRMPSGVAVEASGNVLVTEANGYRVQRFTPSGGIWRRPMRSRGSRRAA